MAHPIPPTQSKQVSEGEVCQNFSQICDEAIAAGLVGGAIAKLEIVVFVFLMNLSPALQQAIEVAAALQGISAEQFIIQTLIEKIDTLQQQAVDSTQILPGQHPQLQDQNGILVIETGSLSHIDFNELIAQLRAERDQEQLCL